MIRGTTPAIKVTIENGSFDMFDEGYFTLKQDKIETNLSIKDGVVIDNVLYLPRLSQEQTLLFDPTKQVRVQMKLRQLDNVVATNIVRMSIYPILYEKVLETQGNTLGNVIEVKLKLVDNETITFDENVTQVMLSADIRTQIDNVVHTEWQALVDSGVLKGDKGDKGDTGSDGFSPVAKVEPISDGAEITITDKVGTTSVTIHNGDDGYSPSAKVETTSTGSKITITDKTGTTTSVVPKGVNGNDGYSPIANVTPITNGARITITDKSGTTSANVYNGTDGQVTYTSVVNALGYVPPQLKDNYVEETSTWSSQKIANKINDIELAKFPNVTIFGQPTINLGQLSNFSATNYAQFPFVVDFQNQPFVLDFEITTGNEINNQHNVFDSAFGLAFAVRSSKFVVAISTNGTSWNIGEGVGTHTVLPNTSYRVKMEWNLSTFVVSYSTDGGTTFITDITKALTSQPFPKTMLIGVTTDKATFFNGIINLNYATLTISNKVVWQGMDDVGLATRMAVNMSNIDEAGTNKVKEIASEIIPTATSELTNDSGFITRTDYATSSVGGVVKTNSNYAISVASNGSPFALTRTIEQYGTMYPGAFVGKATLDNVLAQYMKAQALTQAEYDAIVEKDNGTLYVIVED